MALKLLQKTQTIVRYQNNNGSVHYGMVEDDEILQLSSKFSEIVNDDLQFDGVRVKLRDVKILTPVTPSKVVNFGWTYAEHAKETGGKANLKEPFLFLKPASTLIPNEGEIILPSSQLTNQVEMGEVAIVIGKRGRNIK